MEWVVVAALGAFFGLSWLVWLGGGLLVLVDTGSWREVPPSAAPALLVGLMSHRLQAREAWPLTIRRSLPSSGVVDGWLACLVMVVVLVAAGSWWLALGRYRAGRPKAIAATAAEPTGWAHARDLRPLRLQKVVGDRVVLGTHGGRLLAAETHHSVMVVGPTQSGKTSGLAIPAILEWTGPLLAMSVKADLLHETFEWRRSLGEVQYYDPTDSLGSASDSPCEPRNSASAAWAASRPATWSPLAGAITWPGARRVAAALCSVARSGDGGMEDAGFWYANAEKLLAPLLFAAASAGASIADVVRWLDDEEAAEVLLALELAGVPEALRAARASLGREERQRASVYATAETVLAGFADPAVAASAESCEVNPRALVAGGAGSLFCCAPAREQERLAPVFTAIVRDVLDAAFDRSSAIGRPLDPPLLVVLDEAASVAPLKDLDRVVATAAGHGVQLVTVWQDLAQVESRYGTRWATVVNNHRAKLICPGIADPVTLQHVSGLLGEEARVEHSWTVGENGRRSRTEGVSVQALAPPGWLRQLPPGEAILIYGSCPPARIALRPWFEDPELARRAATGSARDYPMPSAEAVGSCPSTAANSRLGTRRARLTAWSPRRS